MEKAPRKNNWPRRWAVRSFRAALLVAVVVVIRFQADDAEAIQDDIALKDALVLYPTAFALRPGRNFTTVVGEDGEELGYIVKTLPKSEAIIGYAGPSDLLLALDQEGNVMSTALRWSGDTKEHVKAINKEPTFFAAFTGWQFGGENDVAEIDAVSGATLTSFALIESAAVRLGGEKPSLKFPDPIDLEDVQRIFPHATTLAETDGPLWAVHDQNNTLIGRLLRTAPFSDNTMGYQGPSDGLVGFDLDERVVGITLGASYENQRYIDYVRDDEYFTKRHRGLSLAELAEVPGNRAWIDGVSGATMTSGALMDGVIARANDLVAAKEAPAVSPWAITFRLRDGATLFAIAVACIIGFTRLRANRFVRFALHSYLVIILGLWVGDMVSLAVLGGWANGAVPFKSAPGLVALVAAAFLLPWATGKPVYCQQVCPHGAAQTLLYQMIPGRLKIPHRLHKLLLAVPLITLAGGFVILCAGLPVSLSALEPFDAWIFGIGGMATIVIAIVGLIASAFIPQAYCKYGCPTGLLLDYARTRRHEDSLNRRDGVAFGFLILAITLSQTALV